MHEAAEPDGKNIHVDGIVRDRGRVAGLADQIEALNTNGPVNLAGDMGSSSFTLGQGFSPIKLFSPPKCFLVDSSSNLTTRVLYFRHCRYYMQHFLQDQSMNPESSPPDRLKLLLCGFQCEIF